MPLLTYVDPTDFDGIQAEFTIDNGFLKMGGLNRDDLDLYTSILSGTQIGFFSNDRETASVRATQSYATNGIAIANTPRLTVGEAYHIRFTQARPGKTIFPYSGALNPFIGGLGNVYFGRLDAFDYGGKLEPFQDGLLPPYRDHLLGTQEVDPLTGLDIVELLESVEKRIDQRLYDIISGVMDKPRAGEWNPEVTTDTTGSTGGTSGYTIRPGFYAQIGKTVLCFIYIRAVATGESGGLGRGVLKLQAAFPTDEAPTEIKQILSIITLPDIEDGKLTYIVSQEGNRSTTPPSDPKGGYLSFFYTLPE